MAACAGCSRIAFHAAFEVEAQGEGGRRGRITGRVQWGRLRVTKVCVSSHKQTHRQDAHARTENVTCDTHDTHVNVQCTTKTVKNSPIIIQGHGWLTDDDSSTAILRYVTVTKAAPKGQSQAVRAMLGAIVSCAHAAARGQPPAAVHAPAVSRCCSLQLRFKRRTRGVGGLHAP